MNNMGPTYIFVCRVMGRGVSVPCDSEGYILVLSRVWWYSRDRCVDILCLQKCATAVMCARTSTRTYIH